MEKVGFGRVREFPRLEISGTGMSGISRLKIFGNRVPKIREIPGSGGNFSGSGIPGHITSTDYCIKL